MKRYLVAAVSLLGITFINQPVIAQNRTAMVISGKITSFEESLPLEGAGVAVKDSKNITGSQADGTFSLEVTKHDKLLVITLQGYQSQEIKLTGAHEYNIILKSAGAPGLDVGWKKPPLTFKKALAPAE